MEYILQRISDFTFNIFTIIVPPSVIGPNPENLTVVVNNFISLTCEVSGFPPPDLSWFKNEQPIKLNTNALIVPGKELITLKWWAKLSHFSQYKWHQLNSLSELLSCSFYLFILNASLYPFGAIRIRLYRFISVGMYSNKVYFQEIMTFRNKLLSNSLGVID